MSSAATMTRETARPWWWRASTGVVIAVVAQWCVDVGASTIGIGLYLVAIWLLLKAVPESTRLWRALPLPHLMAQPGAVVAGLSALCLVAIINSLTYEIETPGATFWWLYLGTVAGALLMMLVSDWRSTRARHLESSPSQPDHSIDSRPYLALLVVVAVVSVVFRLYDLASLPEGVWFDEATNGNVARRILDESSYRPMWERGTYAAPAHHAYLIAGAIKLGFGVVTSIRIVSVVFGLLAVVGAFLVGRELWGRPGAVVAMALIGLGRWPVTVSRIGMFNVMTPACLLLGLGIVLFGLRTDKGSAILGGGMVLALGLTFHSSMVLALAGASVTLVLVCGLTKGYSLRPLGLALAGAIVIAAPVGGLAVRDWSLYSERQSEVSLFNEDNDGNLSALADNTVDVLAAFNVDGDQNGRHNIPGEPLLDPVVGGLMIVGLALALRHINQPLALGLAAWGLIALLPGVVTLSSEAPNALRMIGVMPVTALFATGGAVAMLTTASRRAIPFMLALLIALVGAWTVKDYFGDWRDDPRVWAAHSIGETIAATAAGEQTEDTQVAAIAQFEFTGVMGLLAPGSVDHIVFDDDVYPLALTGEEDALILAGPWSAALVSEFGDRFGAGAITEHRRGDQLGAVAINLSAAEIRRQQGLEATYRSELEAETASRIERVPGAEPVPIALPALVTWEGLVVIQAAGTHSFGVDGLTDVAMAIDGSAVDPGAVMLHQGPHHLVITGRATDRASAALRWRPPGGEDGVIPPTNLWVIPDRVRGLYGVANLGIDGSGESSRGRLDASLDFLIGQPQADRPRLLRWDGFIDAPVDGFYQLGVETFGERRMTVNGQTVISYDGPGQEQVFLGEGLHRISLEIVDTDSSTRVKLMWGLPDQGLETIPSAALSPPWGPSAEEMSEAAKTPIPPSIDTVPKRFDLEMDRPLAVAASAETVAVAGRDGLVAIRKADGEVIEVDVGVEITDLAARPDGTVVILGADGRVIEVAPGGDARTLVEEPALANARGIDVGPDGTIAVAMTAGSAVSWIDSNGAVTRGEWTSSGSQPVDVLALDDGRYVITDVDPPVVRLIDGQEEVWTRPIPGAGSAEGPHLAMIGNRLFRTDPDGSQVVELTVSGEVVATYRLRTQGERTRPVGIASTGDGSILVVDVAHDQILQFFP